MGFTCFCVGCCRGYVFCEFFCGFGGGFYSFLGGCAVCGGAILLLGLGFLRFCLASIFVGVWWTFFLAL